MQGKDLAMFGGLAGVGILLLKNKEAVDDALSQLTSGFGGGFGGFSLPDISLPDINLPSFNLPDFSLPDISLPDFGAMFSDFSEAVSNKVSDVTQPFTDFVDNTKQKINDTQNAINNGIDTTKEYGEVTLKGAGLAIPAGILGALGVGSAGVGGLIIGAGGASAFGGYSLRKHVISNTGQTPENNIKSFWDRLFHGGGSIKEGVAFGLSPLITTFVESAMTQPSRNDFAGVSTKKQATKDFSHVNFDKNILGVETNSKTDISQSSKRSSGSSRNYSPYTPPAQERNYSPYTPPVQERNYSPLPNNPYAGIFGF